MYIIFGNYPSWPNRRTEGTRAQWRNNGGQSQLLRHGGKDDLLPESVDSQIFEAMYRFSFLPACQAAFLYQTVG